MADEITTGQPGSRSTRHTVLRAELRPALLFVGGRATIATTRTGNRRETDLIDNPSASDAAKLLPSSIIDSRDVPGRIHGLPQRTKWVGIPLSSIRTLLFLFIAALLASGIARPVRAQAPITIGDSNLESADDSGNGNLLLAQAATLPQSAKIVSLSFFVTQASGNLILGLYDATGPRGGPGKLLAATSSFVTANGWNTANVAKPVSLAAGNYWLAYLPSSGNLAFLKQNNSGSCVYRGQTFSRGMPATFATSTSKCAPTTWSFYATAVPSGGGTVIIGACGSSNGANLTGAPITNLCSAGTASSVTGAGPWNWMCAGSGGGATASCSAQLQINGLCGSANGGAVTTAPTMNLCGAGTASKPTGTGPWAWSCNGSHGGSTASCSAPLLQQTVDGSCGSANGVSASTSPTANLCSTGTASTIAGTGPWAWSCTGSTGGSTAFCSAPLSQQVVNGTCGSANGVPISTAPTTNLCGTGSALAVTGTGPWGWACAGSNGGTTASCAAPVGSTPSPTLVQHVASSANPLGLGVPGNNFNIPLPNTVLAGDALVLAITYPHGNTSMITDSLGQIWPAAAITEDGGAGNYVAQIYVLCGAAAGNETITVGLTGSSLPFEYTVSEFNNVATTGCVDGSAGGSNLAPNRSAVVNPGGFTPSTNNDTNGGHIIWNYTALSSIANGNPSTWAAATGFTLLDGDIAWINKQGFPHASQWYLQTTNGSVTPSVASMGDTADTFNSASVALLVANAGATVPSGIHINKIVHETWVALSSGTTLTLQLPATGNLRVLAFPAGQNNINITSITDNEGGTWALQQTGGDSPQIWYAGNRTPNSNLTVSIHSSGSSPTNSVRFFDIQGASASSMDVAAGTDLTSCDSGTINSQPTITPTGPNELVIATMGIGNGPGLGLGVGAPDGAVWDITTFSGEVDTDLMENADALAHVYTAATSVENWNWNITPNSNNSCSAEAVAFK